MRKSVALKTVSVIFTRLCLGESNELQRTYPCDIFPEKLWHGQLDIDNITRRKFILINQLFEVFLLARIV